MSNPNPQIALGVLDLIGQAGPIAKLVLLILLAASVMCWGVIFSKWISLKRAALENGQFLEIFWRSKTIDEIVEKTSKLAASPVASVFRSGVKELKKLSSDELQGVGVEKIDNIQRALFRASTTEVSTLEKNVGLLATTASAAPFVGLFGTVWGIMTSFQSIGASGSANLAVVAPGISEALITTAMGIAAAIPAVIAYNHFAGQIRQVAVEMEGFSQDFINIVQRSVLAGSSKKGN
jgi:biopolymer transport protein TolQ